MKGSWTSCVCELTADEWTYGAGSYGNPAVTGFPIGSEEEMFAPTRAQKNRMILGNIDNDLVQFKLQGASVDDDELEVHLSAWSKASAGCVQDVADYDRATFGAEINLRQAFRFR